MQPRINNYVIAVCNLINQSRCQLCVSSCVIAIITPYYIRYRKHLNARIAGIKDTSRTRESAASRQEEQDSHVAHFEVIQQWQPRGTSISRLRLSSDSGARSSSWRAAVGQECISALRPIGRSTPGEIQNWCPCKIAINTKLLLHRENIGI
ncbi:hypothetical protein BDV34DRAFT_202899 [Aspergillus parasiticus]|uniref:Uncharacterized protein n=1 Tax=Aspergillus parasiticus TaxID=5067 RepID=A0A5N6D8P6_ASPPA|nr:hypothetical protein BDV34DRAFT_202899 [Aspergillus parasiticus]